MINVSSPRGRDSALDDNTELYGNYVVSPGSLRVCRADSALSPRGNTWVPGGRDSLQDGRMVFSEQRLSMNGAERSFTRLAGLQMPLNAKTRLVLRYENGVVDPLDTQGAHLLRNGGSVGLDYSSRRMTATVSLDGRHDDGPSGVEIYAGAQGRLDFHINEDVTVATALRGGSVFARSAGEYARGQEAWEGALGMALRPLSYDWLNLFARYALTHERLPDGATVPTWVNALSHTIAVNAVFDVLRRLSLGPKIAYRQTRIDLDNQRTHDRALLTALRGDVHLNHSWDATVEGRMCSQPGRGDMRTGALAEASVLAMPWLRVGAGYNFSAISAGSVRCNSAGARGVFMRAEALY
ncbi:MAG: hypothetical protein R3C68_11635 [Myxococcota bacterium]